MTHQDITSSLYTYLRTLAHEMAGPLTTVLGYSQLLQSSLGANSVEIQEDLREIEASTQTLRKMVNQLGRFARYLPDEKSSSVQEIMEDLSELAVATARRFHCRLNVRVQPIATDILVRANPWLLRVCLLSLLLELFQESQAEVDVRMKSDVLQIRLTRPPRSRTEGKSDDSSRWEEAIEGLQQLGAALSEEEGDLVIRLAVDPAGNDGV